MNEIKSLNSSWNDNVITESKLIFSLIIQRFHSKLVNNLVFVRQMNKF